MIDNKVCKKMRNEEENEEQDEHSLCVQEKETAQHLTARAKTIAGTVCKRRHDNVLKVLAVKWAIDNSIS